MSWRFNLNRGRCVVFTCGFALAGLGAAPPHAETLRIYHIDVEQGDATLLVGTQWKDSTGR